MKARHAYMVLLAVLCSFSAQAQEIDPAVLAISGGYARTASMSISWTVGQTAVATHQSHAGTISEGFQQAFLSVIPIREESIPFSLDLYPNPTRYSVLVRMAGVDEDMTLVVYDLLGSEVMRENVRSGDQVTRLTFDSMPSGLYMLAAFSGKGKQLGLYKIVKAQ
ncbi:T9SS type A sorting domain-containing protein [bacterium]|nr:T9SS type A sorting domain-containing protein [bacterium]